MASARPSGASGRLPSSEGGGVIDSTIDSTIDSSMQAAKGVRSSRARRGALRTDPLAHTGLGNTLGWKAITGSLGFFMRTLFRVKRVEMTPLPEGPLIIAPNHRSFLDPAIIGSFADRRVIFMMHAKYYDHPSLNWLYRMARCIPVESGSENRRALREGKRVLDADRPLVIFPEGTISPDGEPQEPQPGMAWLARKSEAPVYPVYLGGTREAMTKGSWRVRLRPIELRSGAPRWRSEFPPGREGDDEFSRAIMADIETLGRTQPRR
jgi:1-acyl-sn-glycerol-3-phosphate acyltransferase